MKTPSSESPTEQADEDFKNKIRKMLTPVEGDTISFVASLKPRPLVVDEALIEYKKLQEVGILCKTDLGNEIFIKAGYFELHHDGLRIHALILENAKKQLVHVILQPDWMFGMPK